MKRAGGKATIAHHSAVFGRQVTEVRTWTVSEPEPYAQYSLAVVVSYREPRQRRSWVCRVFPDNLKYLTIEEAGEVVYDSRADVPCDMDKHAASWAKHQHIHGFSVRRI